jgi:tRNA(Arg) A34 adenosine deaminase TadA
MLCNHPTFEEQVANQIDRLKNKKLNIIEAEVTTKRTAWFDSLPVGQRPPVEARPSPRFAFEMLSFRYMGLRPEDLPVLKEDEKEIVWSSRNPCPTLEACKRLGLDTRVVCRAAYEKSTQAFVSRIDPQLRFLRDYVEIRPFSPHCRERIVRVSFEDMMRLALEEARQSRLEGNKGYGAVAVLGTRVLARAHDTAGLHKDPSLHAEVNVIREAVHVLGEDNLSGVILFSTCEPCPMCSSLAVWANVTTIVFGASIEQTSARGKARILVPVRQIVNRSPVAIEIVQGVLEQECLSLY